MSKDIIISETPEETRMALVEDDRLAEYIVERSSERHLVGSIFTGKVKNIVRGLQAAFIDIGREQNAFLFVPEDSVVNEGQTVIVQIAKDSRGTKGPMATRSIALPGKYLVLLPFSNYVGVSHKIKGKEEKTRLKELIEQNKPTTVGCVIRTLAEGVSEDALLQDLTALLATWRIVCARAKRSTQPTLLFRELDLPVRIVRDYLAENVRRIIFDNEVTYKRVKELVADLDKKPQASLQHFAGKSDIFAYYKVSEEISTLDDRKIWLSCGGYLVLDHTEAMTVIDVNSGKFQGRTSLEETVLEINKQAAIEIARQLRLRDIGGIIIIDFIDMARKETQKQVLDALAISLENDKMKPKVQGITALNLVEITRKKARQNSAAVLYAPCPVCQGSGKVQSPETITVEIRRRLRHLLVKRLAAKDILLTVHPYVGEWLERHNLKDLEKEFGCTISVEKDPALHEEAFCLLDNA
ncbi:MAG TPA: Rne/Rng family ribonuclease [Candidatus Avacidaminococcus intestinavium]|uniref:Ribonuclease G n=1 Tax=Candidatus Avacidaminococcus intestinavium TaxID=2840684 RepID=A0A9D1MQC1_9FIRM|nr:Rne/Rng family ribonuclease [Candidatus Avacidaminococcus intestinavium]